MNINNIYENNDVINYLKKRDLIKQYQKSKRLILNSLNTKTFFKDRKPK